MVDMHFNSPNNNGFVLVTVLIFLLVTSLLAISLLNMSLLEDRVNIFYQDKIRAFYDAENKLLAMERKILTGNEIPNVEIIDADICGVTFYRLTARKEYRGAKNVLQSIFAIVGDVGKCSEKPKIVTGRQSFLIIS